MSLRKNNKKPLAILISPPVYDFAFYDLFVKPYGLLKIAASLARAGYEIRFIDCLDHRDRMSVSMLGKPDRSGNGTGKVHRQKTEKPSVLGDISRYFSRYGIVSESIVSQLGEEKPDIILISSGMTYWYPGVREVSRLAKTIYPGVPVVVGGIYASLLPVHCKRETEADFVVSGNAFPALSEICEKLMLPVPVPCPSGEIFLHETLSGAAAIRLNKGCPLSCDYCASHVISGNFERGDPVKSFEAIESVHWTYGTRNVAFYDDALLASKEHVFVPFLERVVASGLSFNFYLPNGIHLEYLDDATACLMKKAGFREIRVGFESSSVEFHEQFDRKLDSEILKGKVELLKNAGFGGPDIGVYILAGLPGQRSMEVEDSIRYVGRFGVRIRVAEYSPVPRSMLWDRCVRECSFPIDEEPLCQNNSLFPMQWEDFTYDDLERLKQLAYSLSART